MGQNRCFQYNGRYYDVGTKVVLRTMYNGDVVTTYLGYRKFEGYDVGYYLSGMRPEQYIKEIIAPVYYQEPPIDESEKNNILFSTGSGSAEHNDDVFHGFLLYLAVMLGGILFNDRWLIWIMATIVYFSWKNKL